jgi:pimeloyl-ACP methyl ester carboxylesterase
VGAAAVRVIRTRGAEIACAQTGTGPPVLLIQGAGVIGEGWRFQVAGLADRFTLVTFDNRGIGGSRLLDGPLTIEAMAEDALAVMDAAGADRVHVVGHSMGGSIAQQLALTVPRRIRSLALLCTFPRGRDGARLTPAMVLAGLRTRIGTRAMRRHAFLELVMPAEHRARHDPARLAEELRPLFGHDPRRHRPVPARHDPHDRRAQGRGGDALRACSAARPAGPLRAWSPAPRAHRPRPVLERHHARDDRVRERRAPDAPAGRRRHLRGEPRHHEHRLDRLAARAQAEPRRRSPSR